MLITLRPPAPLVSHRALPLLLSHTDGGLRSPPCSEHRLGLLHRATNHRRPSVCTSRRRVLQCVFRCSFLLNLFADIVLPLQSLFKLLPLHPLSSLSWSRWLSTLIWSKVRRFLLSPISFLTFSIAEVVKPVVVEVVKPVMVSMAVNTDLVEGSSFLSFVDFVF